MAKPFFLITPCKKGSTYFFRLITAIFTFILITGCFSPLISSADTNTPQEAFSEEFSQITGQSKYKYSTWGLMACDTNSGQTVVAENEETLFVPGSTTKVFTVSAALATLGSDYRFKTPVYNSGKDLILVASGDPAMGGREESKDILEYTSHDHVDAGVFGKCTLVESDPLAGLDELAEKSFSSGITSVEDVIIDARLFEQTKLTDKQPVTPILINDNLIDITITPGKTGETAGIDWRPKSSAYTVKSSIMTLPSGSETAISVQDYTGQKTIEVTGSIPADSAAVNLTSVVMVPENFARALFIDALEKQGVYVKAGVENANPTEKLPEKGWYENKKALAELISPPFSEYAKVTLKVSQNLYANCLLGIIATYNGSTSIDAGLFEEGIFLNNAGIDPDSLSLVDGEGSIKNRISPAAATELALYMTGTDNYQVLKDALPVFGVDGTLSEAATPENPGYKQIYAKTGTSVTGDMSGRAFLYARGLLGYMTTKNGNDLAFVVYVNNVPGAVNLQDIQGVVDDVNRVAVGMYQYL